MGLRTPRGPRLSTCVAQLEETRKTLAEIDRCPASFGPDGAVP